MARTLEQLEESPGLSLDLDAAVATAFPRREIDPTEAAALSHGQRLRPGGFEGTYGVFGPDGHVIALVRDEGDAAKPVVVLSPAG